MAKKEKKQRKLTRAEKDLLKAMDRELQEQQNAANTRRAEIDAVLSEGISQARKESSAEAYAAQQTFEKEKKALDKKKKAELKEVEENYQIRLAAVRSTKTYAHSLLEEKLNSHEYKLRRAAQKEEKEVDAALAAFLQDYNARRDLLLYGAPEEEKPEAEDAKKPAEPTADKVSASVEA